MSTSSTDRARGTGPFYLVALACSLLSLDTAARFFSGRMGIDGLDIRGFSVELAAVCGVGELTLIACGYAMRHNVRRNDNGKPGAAQLVALVMCTAASFMAVALDGPVAGGLRAFFGPVLALIALHLALGIEVKVRPVASAGTWAKIVAEARERFMSRLGLGNDGREAAERTRDRARERAARLATDDKAWWRDRRLARAVRASGATLDPDQRGRLLEQVAVLKHITDLTAVDVESPWSAAVPAHVQRLADDAQRGIEAQRAAADRDAAALFADAQQAAAALREAVQRDADEALRRVEAQRREAVQYIAAAQAEAAQIRAAADKVAAEERRAADDHRRHVERQSQQQYEQLIAAARAEAAEIRSAARGDAQVLRSTVNRSIESSAGGAAPQRSNGRSAAAIEELVAALAQQWPAENPSDRAAIKFLRQRFNGCGDQRARDAAAALRARRSAAPDAADAEHLQVAAIKVNGFSHNVPVEAS
jgi:hypothetical protein